MAGVTPSTLPARLQKVQSFQEVTWGTPGPATAKWMAIQPNPTFTPIFKSVFVDEDRGSFAPSFISYVPETGGLFSFTWDTATYEDILFALLATMGSVTPTGGPNYVWTNLGPLNTVWSPQSYTIELAYDIATIQAVGVLTNKLSIKMNAKKNWTITQSGLFQQLNQFAAVNIASSTNASPIVITTSSPHGLPSSGAFSVVIAGHLVNTNANGTWIGTYLSPTTFSVPGTGNGVGVATGTVTRGPTPSIADRTVEPILFAGQTALAIDIASGTPGTTPVSNTLVSASIDIDNQLQGFYTGDQKYPVDFSMDKFKIDLTAKLKWNAQVKALYNSYFSTGARTVWQIKATSGSKSCEIDLAAVLSSDPQNYTPEYAALAQELKFEGQYDPGALANYIKIITTNTVSALP